jgi:hypothetical protein
VKLKAEGEKQLVRLIANVAEQVKILPIPPTGSIVQKT